jgi:hypothetical protein
LIIFPLDTYDQGQKDIHDEENMEMSDEEDNDQRTNEKLLPPEVFQHIDLPPEPEKIKPELTGSS